ncbi:MAG: M48 family peptidase, partial [Methylophaga sp.]|nr:M48 family peptidase [Methylophaga sp.]
MMNEFTWVFVIALLLMTGVEIWLSLRQKRHVLAKRDQVPPAFSEQISLEAHQKAADYSVAKGKFKRTEALYGAVILLAWTLGGGLAWLSGAWQSLDLSATVTGILFVLSFLVIGSLLELPTSWFKTFVMEDKFGFNRSTPAVFFGDFAKQMLLMLVLGALIIWATLWLMTSTGE